MTISHFKHPRLFTYHDLKSDELAALNPAQAHYLKNVMRMADGGRVRIFNGRDGEWLAEIEGLSKKGGAARPVTLLRAQDTTGASGIDLFFCPLVKARMDWLIEKAVELGVRTLRPVTTQNCEVRTVKTERIEAQIIEAAEQCERMDIPRLHPISSLDRAAADYGAPILACVERRDASPLHPDMTAQASAILIGPPGGFTEAEKEILTQNSNFIPVSLGPRILRSETAALYALSILNGG